MLLDYLAHSRARREVWKTLYAGGQAMTVRAIAAKAGLPYSNAHREVLRMREVGLLRTQVVGKALLCTWNDQNPATRNLKALLAVLEPSRSFNPSDDMLYGSLKSWGAGLSVDPAPKPLGLEDTLAYGIALARQDPSVAQAWPVVLAKNRTRVNFHRLEILIRRLGQKRAFGFLLTLTGVLLEDASLLQLGHRFRDSRVRVAQDFFVGSEGKRMRALTPANSPELAREWHFRMNTSLESFRSHFEKFARTNHYSTLVRKRSGLGEAKRQGLIEQARRMTPQQRLEACVRLSSELSEIQRAGAAHRSHATPGRS